MLLYLLTFYLTSKKKREMLFPVFCSGIINFQATIAQIMKYYDLQIPLSKCYEFRSHYW